MNPFSMPDLHGWCRGEGTDPEHTIIVSEISEDTEIGMTEDILHSIKVLGRVRVRGRMFNPIAKCLIVLCDCCEKVKKD